GNAPRIHVIFRRPSPWRGLIGALLPSPLVTTLDPVAVLRSFHRHTAYRLSHQESVRRRSYHVEMVELTLQPGLEYGDP
ncbi:MAG: hypothetical protein WBD27_07770, partial [Pyrinomonadaceae bacterium]